MCHSASCTIMLSALWLLLACTTLTWIEITSKPCNGRQVYTAGYGVVTDGLGDYPASAHCEWLIQGKIRCVVYLVDPQPLKVKVCHLYSASSEILHFWSAQRGSHSFLHCKFYMPPLPRSSPGGATTEWTVIAPADEANYSFIDCVRMKGWVGLVGWPTADGLPIWMVTHQLQVRCRPVKVRRSETDVLPLSHPTSLCGYSFCLSMEGGQAELTL